MWLPPHSWAKNENNLRVRDPWAGGGEDAKGPEVSSRSFLQGKVLINFLIRKTGGLMSIPAEWPLLITCI